jgi:uncharacterized protein YaiI (UPF0178 family)
MSAVRILIDADACPVKDEVYRVSWRHEVPVKVVSNAHLRVPAHPLIERVVVSDAFDAADVWIAEQADARTALITGDILLADRCLKKGATVIGPNGASRSPRRASAAQSRRGRSWRICVAVQASPVVRRRSRRRTAPGFYGHWMPRWCAYAPKTLRMP